MSGFFSGFFSRGLGGGFFSWGVFISPVRVGDTKFVSTDWVACLERFGANAFLFSLNAVLRVAANKAKVWDENFTSVEEGETITLPEWEVHTFIVALETGHTALSFETFSKKSVEKTDFAAGPANGYANLSMKASLAHGGAPANGVATAVFGQ